VPAPLSRTGQAVICNRKSAVHDVGTLITAVNSACLGIIANQFCFETRCFVYHLLQAEPFKLQTVFVLQGEVCCSLWRASLSHGQQLVHCMGQDLWSKQRLWLEWSVRGHYRWPVSEPDKCVAWLSVDWMWW